MKPNSKEIPVVFVHPGEVCFTRKPIIISTILGSCISVIMYHRKTKYSGFSHCQLPNSNNDCIKGKCFTDQYKYVDSTIIKMLEKFESMKINRDEIEVKIFGGADVLEFYSDKNRNTIGKQNILSVSELIKANGISITSADIGGNQGRKIFFKTSNGEVYLKRI
jgi:chemotaxis protein CheD